MARTSRIILRDDVARLVTLDTETGLLTWLERPGEASFNKRHAGKPALSGISADGYRRGYIAKRMTLAHRVVYAIVHGACDTEIDHIDGNRLNNRPDNLRAATATDNNRNLARPRNNSSGVVGVSRTSDGAWRAHITLDNRYTHLGRFKAFEDAVDARRSAERAHGFHPNHGRMGAVA